MILRAATRIRPYKIRFSTPLAQTTARRFCKRFSSITQASMPKLLDLRYEFQECKIRASQYDQSTDLDLLLQVFDAIAAECANQQIWVHLDNHVSKAQWCCSETDGNAWFGGLSTLERHNHKCRHFLSRYLLQRLQLAARSRIHGKPRKFFSYP